MWVATHASFAVGNSDISSHKMAETKSHSINSKLSLLVKGYVEFEKPIRIPAEGMSIIGSSNQDKKHKATAELNDLPAGRFKTEAYCEVSAPFGQVERDRHSREFSSRTHP